MIAGSTPWRKRAVMSVRFVPPTSTKDWAAAAPLPTTTTGLLACRSKLVRQVAEAIPISPVRVSTSTIDHVASAAGTTASNVAAARSDRMGNGSDGQEIDDLDRCSGKNDAGRAPGEGPPRGISCESVPAQQPPASHATKKTSLSLPSTPPSWLTSAEESPDSQAM